jgi:hypothetical protein
MKDLNISKKRKSREYTGLKRHRQELFQWNSNGSATRERIGKWDSM